MRGGQREGVYNKCDGAPSNLLEMHAPGPSDEQMHCCTKLLIKVQIKRAAADVRACCPGHLR